MPWHENLWRLWYTECTKRFFIYLRRGGGGGGGRGANDVFVYGGIITKSYISRYGKTSPQYKADNKFWSLLLSNNRHCLLCVLYTPLCHLTKEWRSVIIPAVNTLYTYTLYTLYTLQYTVKKVKNFPSPAGMSLTKRSLAGNNEIIPGIWRVWFSDIPAGDGKIINLFLQCTVYTLFSLYKSVIFSPSTSK